MGIVLKNYYTIWKWYRKWIANNQNTCYYENKAYFFQDISIVDLKYISEIILEKILRANRAEVIAVSIFEYNKEEEEQKLRKAEYEAGVEAGVEAGIEAGIAEGELKKARETALSLAEMGFPVDKIAEAVKINRDKVEEWMKESMSIV